MVDSKYKWLVVESVFDQYEQKYKDESNWFVSGISAREYYDHSSNHCILLDVKEWRGY